MSAHEFVRRLKSNSGESDRHYTFWIGAGCSVSSGIPAAAALVKDNWLPRLYDFKNPGVSLDEWAQETFEDYDPENLGVLYGPLMNALFLLKDDRQRETERLCQAAEPGYGYAILAGLMSRPDGIFSAALTTNFDDLIADSMYSYWNRRPLVIQHDALASFIRPGRVRRPLVVKVHGDHRLSPMHTDIETSELEEGIRKGVQGLLHDRGVIFMGYSGNDQGVIKALKGLPPEAIPLGVWWVSSSEPTGAIRSWLSDRNATWVHASGFDELMLLLQQKFEIPHPTAQKFEEMIERYQAAYEQLGARVEGLPGTAPDSEALKEAARSARETAPDWWRVELEARQFRDTDPDRTDQIYRDGIERLGDPRLLGNYALFLSSVRKEPDRAEEFFERAIEADPERANAVGNYANFLSDVRKDADRADEFYRRAIEIDPDHSNNLGNYGLFLSDRNEPDRAEEFFRRSLEIDPERANVLGGYAYFLDQVRKDPDRAEENYRRALEAEPERVTTLSNYAYFLATRKDPDRAEEFYERAVAAGPEDPKALGAYALFLKNVRKDPDRAERFYKRAIAADPMDAGNLGNYANFLSDIHKDLPGAEEFYKRAIEIDPDGSNNLGNYARLLLEIGRDSEAWPLIDKALGSAADEALLIELWFYILALGDKEKRRQALVELARLVGAGSRSPGWSFDGVLARARELDRPDIEWLSLLSDVIADRADAEDLDAWDQWSQAEE